MSRQIHVLLVVLAVVAMAAACAAPAAPTEAPPVAPTEAPPEAPAEEPQGLPGELEGMTWSEILAAADGGEVNWWMWGGSDVINTWVTGWAADRLKEHYNITLNQVPVAGPTEFINQVLGEKEAGVDTDGAVSIMWINAENFLTMKEAGLLYGPFAEQIPNARYVTWDDTSRYDAGYPIEGYESIWGRAWGTFGYDSAKVPDPPKTLDELIQWIKDNPGGFTYPALPEFVGSMFVRLMCVHVTGGYEQYLGPFDQELFDEKMPACWEMLNEIEPYLWRGGETYPRQSQLPELFGQGETLINVNTSSGGWQTQIDAGKYPETVRGLVLENASIISPNFIAIAYNAPDMAAAVVATDWLLGPEAQYGRAVTLNSVPGIDVRLVPPEWQEKFDAIDVGVNPAWADLIENGIPEIRVDWWVPIEEGWKENVLMK